MGDIRCRFLDGFEGFTLAAYTRLLGWSKAEVQAHGQKVKRDAMNPKIHAIHIVYAQKPTETPTVT
ncbi:MAG: hypothetical protein M1840_003271 [Geoglossum simile]|nr:MAG: hypothetical protein M1840_003271 [Geoglossum simile]